MKFASILVLLGAGLFSIPSQALDCINLSGTHRSPQRLQVIEVSQVACRFFTIVTRTVQKNVFEGFSTIRTVAESELRPGFGPYVTTKLIAEDGTTNETIRDDHFEGSSLVSIVKIHINGSQVGNTVRQRYSPLPNGGVTMATETINSDGKVIQTLTIEFTESVKGEVYENSKPVEDGAHSKMSDVCDRTVAIREQLELLAGLPCSRISQKHLESLRGMLFLTGKRINPLKKSDLAALHSLDVFIYTRENAQPVSIEEGAFQAMGKLKQIEFFAMRLARIYPGMFNGLSELEFINLGAGQLTKLESGSFEGLKKLKTLNFTNNQIQQIENGAFAGLPELEMLILDQNPVARFPNGLFRGLEKLQFLSLRFTRVPILESDTFAGLSSLKTLILDNANIEKLMPHALRGLSRLENLYLSLNFFGRLDSGSFAELRSLKKLVLIRVPIVEIEAGAFRGLEQLEVLYLVDTPLRRIEAGMLRGLTALKTLYFNGNQRLEYFDPEAVAELPKIETILFTDSGSFMEPGNLAELKSLFGDLFKF